MVVSFIWFVSLQAQKPRAKATLVVDGEQLRCYHVALDYLVTNGKWKPFPFQIEQRER